MAQKLNKKLVGFLVVSIMILMTITGVVLLENLPDQDPTKYAADGDRFLAEGEFEKATQAFHRAFMKDPNQNPDYLVKAAKCAIEMGDPIKARSLIQYAKVRDPKHKNALELDLDLEFEIAPLIGSVNQWNQVIERAKSMIEMDEFTGLAKAHYALGKAYLELRKEDATYETKGEAELRRALELDPTSVDVVTALAEQISRNALEREADRQQDEARALRASRLALLSAAIEKCADPEAADSLAELKLLQARCLIMDGEADKGVAALRELAAAETTGTDARLLLSRLLSGNFKVNVQRDLPAAEQYLTAALKSDPRNALLYFALANIYKVQLDQSKDDAEKKSKHEALTALYTKGLEEIPQTKHYRKLADNKARVQFFEELFLHELGRAREAKNSGDKEQRLAAAESWIEKMKAERPPEALEVRFTTAHLYSARGDIIAATREAEAALATSEGANNPAVLRLCADLYTQQSQWGAARDMIARLIAFDPGDPSLYVGMARVLLALNQAPEALAYLKPTESPSVRAALEKDRTAITLEIEAYRQLKQYDLANQAADRLGDDMPEDATRLALILVWEGKYAEAEQKLKAVLAADAVNDGAVRAMLQLYEAAGRRDDARAFIADLAAKHPDERRFRQYQLTLMDDAGKDKDQQILEFINQETDELVRYSSLASYYEKHGELEKAIQNLDLAEKARPESANIVEAQFALAIRKKEWNRAAKYARRSAELNTDGTQGKIAEGRLAQARGVEAKENKKPEEAKKLLDQAIDQMKVGLDLYPKNSQGWTFLASAYLDAGRVDDAKVVLQRALQINPANAYASMFLARIAATEGDDTAERKYLADASRTLGDDPWIRDQQRIFKEKDDPQSGITQRETQAREKPDDVGNLVQLARLYADAKVAQYDKAADTYKKALAASKNDLSLVVEFADFYGEERVNQPAEGEKLLKDLFEQESDKPRKALIAAALGRFYEGQHVLATADRHFRQAAFIDPSLRILTLVAEFYSRTGKLKEAIEQYEKLVPLAASDSEKLQDVKARMIALLLTVGDLDRAKGMIDEYIAAYPSDPQGMILEGAYHRIGGDIEKAKAALDAHLAKDPDNPVALWQRGQLYLLRGRWELAIDDLKKAKAFKPDGFNYQHRIALADALIEAGRGDEAIGELQLILEANPEEAAVAESLIDAYTRVRPARFADAENLIYRYQSRFPRDYKWPMMLGQLGELAMDWDKAITGYEKAAEVGNYQPELIRALFAAYRAANRPQKIIQFATEKLSTRLLEKIPEALSSLGWAYAQMRMQARCFEAFDHALAASGNNFQSYSRVVGDIVVTLGREAALERARQQCDADPENVAKLQALVHLLKINDESTEALQVCDKIQQLAGSDNDIIFAHLAKGMLLSSDKKFAEARTEYEKILKINPDQPMTLNNLAYILGERLNQPAEALPYAKRAAQLQPGDTNVLDTYGWTLFLNDRPGEAAGTLLRAIERDDRLPEQQKNADVRYHLGLLYKDQGKSEDAQAMLKMARKVAEAQGRQDELPKKIEAALAELEKRPD